MLRLASHYYDSCVRQLDIRVIEYTQAEKHACFRFVHLCRHDGTERDRNSGTRVCMCVRTYLYLCEKSRTSIRVSIVRRATLYIFKSIRYRRKWETYEETARAMHRTHGVCVCVVGKKRIWLELHLCVVHCAYHEAYHHLCSQHKRQMCERVTLSTIHSSILWWPIRCVSVWCGARAKKTEESLHTRTHTYTNNTPNIVQFSHSQCCCWISCSVRKLRM